MNPKIFRWFKRTFLYNVNDDLYHQPNPPRNSQEYHKVLSTNSHGPDMGGDRIIDVSHNTVSWTQPFVKPVPTISANANTIPPPKAQKWIFFSPYQLRYNPSASVNNTTKGGVGNVPVFSQIRILVPKPTQDNL